MVLRGEKLPEPTWKKEGESVVERAAQGSLEEAKSVMPPEQFAKYEKNVKAALAHMQGVLKGMSPEDLEVLEMLAKEKAEVQIEAMGPVKKKKKKGVDLKKEGEEGMAKAKREMSAEKFREYEEAVRAVGAAKGAEEIEKAAARVDELLERPVMKEEELERLTGVLLGVVAHLVTHRGLSTKEAVGEALKGQMKRMTTTQFIEMTGRLLRALDEGGP